MSTRRAAVCLWTLTGAVLALLLVKFFVADVYRVDSGSMRPTLFGGRERPDGEDDSERVLVRYDQAPPARFDLVVIRSPDGEKPLVKRVCGLPGDQDLMIRDGDLFVDRKRLPADAPRPAPVPVYDDRYQEPERFFELPRAGAARREGNAWVVEGDAHAPGSLLLFHPELRDDYLDRHGKLVPGVVEVNDARLELEFALEQPRAGELLRFELTEEGDLFEVVLEPHASDGTTVRLVRDRSEPEASGHAERELRRTQLPLALEAGRWYDLEFSNIDNHLRVRSRALGLDLAQDYDENEPLHEPSEGRTGPSRPQNLGPRVRFGVQDGRARFRGVRVLRDLFYTEDGRFGVRHRPDASRAIDGPYPSGDAVSLGPDDYFLLGDNSAASTDSRHFGPRKASDLLGRPLFVVWPDPHWLRATEDP